MDSVLRLLMGPWTTYILWLLQNEGAMRFGALRRAMPGISAKVLTDRLRHLETAGVVTRTVRPTTPPEVSYALTPRGDELKEALSALNRVAEHWATQDAGN